MKTLHELILESINNQKVQLLHYVETNCKSVESTTAVEHIIESIVFSENDVLERQLQSIGLTIEDIDSNEYRDLQHTTITECCNLYLSLSNN